MPLARRAGLHLPERRARSATALWNNFDLFWPHLQATLQVMFSGYAIGAAVGIVLAAVITQFPFVEKIITPYILLLVTTPMIALVPLLVLKLGFGDCAPR